MIRADGSGSASRTPIDAGISYPMQENPNSRWQYRPPVTHTLSRSPGGPPAAAMITSPGRACSCRSPMTWPWVRTAPVVVTMSESGGTVPTSKVRSGSIAAARVVPRMPSGCRTRSCQAAGERVPAAATASARAARASRASPMIGVAPSRSASRGLMLMLANRTSGWANSDWEAVVKSVSRDPTVSTRSASPASRLTAGVPSRPMPPTCHQAGRCTAPLPANVSATGRPAVSASRSSSAVAPE